MIWGAPLFQLIVACGLVRGETLFILTSFQRSICPEEFEHVISYDFLQWFLGRLRFGRSPSIEQLRVSANSFDRLVVEPHLM